MAAVANLMATWLAYDPTDMGFGYFLTAELVVVAALIGYCMLPQLVSSSQRSNNIQNIITHKIVGVYIL